MLNLFIAIIVNAMQSQHEAERVAGEQVAHDERGQILDELRALRLELTELRGRLRDTARPSPKHE